MISHVLCMSLFHQQYLIANIMCIYVQRRHQTYDSDQNDEDIGKADSQPEPDTDYDSDRDDEDVGKAHSEPEPDTDPDDENRTQVREIS